MNVKCECGSQKQSDGWLLTVFIFLKVRHFCTEQEFPMFLLKLRWEEAMEEKIMPSFLRASNKSEL